MKLRHYQETAVCRAIEGLAHHQNPLLILPTGCHAKGHLILMATGEKIPVENVRVGDKVMGINGQHRTVLQLHQGVDDMYKITPKKGGAPFVVNKGHILYLHHARDHKKAAYYDCISVEEYLTKSKYYKHCSHLVKDAIDFTAQPTPLDAWTLGFLIGDGSLNTGVPTVTVCDNDAELIPYLKKVMKKINIQMFTLADKTLRKSKSFSLSRIIRKHNDPNKLREIIRKLRLNVTSGFKFVPKQYKYNTDMIRNDILSGLLDSDGHYTKKGFDWISKSKQLADDVIFLAQSLGLSATLTSCIKSCQNNFSGKYYRVSISGNLEKLNIRSSRRKPKPRAQIKNNLHRCFTVEEVGKGEYFGFTLDLIS